MSADPPSQPAAPSTVDGVHDSTLVRRIISRDAEALNQLISRYDRLVRFAIYRLSKSHCLRDPQWLDSVASETWSGFVDSMSRSGVAPPTSTSSFLVRIARNKTVSAIRRESTRSAGVQLDSVEDHNADPVANTIEPDRAAEDLELLTALRDCLSDLAEDDQALASQLRPIVDRRWSEASKALGMAESTLRSRWKHVLQRLRGCLRGKIGRDFAPWAGNRDS